MHYGFVGLGNLGEHLARSLLGGGFQVTVNDLNKTAATELLTEGAAWADSPGETALVSDALITCLPSPAAVDQVLTGEDGAFAQMPAGNTWIEMSTNGMAEVKRLAGLAASRDISTLEAPVTGGVHKAAHGDITVLVGGGELDYHRHLPAFKSMGGEVFHMGPLGNASIIKVITNMLAFIHLVACGEGLMLAKRGGLDLKQSYDAICASSGNSFVHETEGQVILNGSYDIGFTMDLACKDLGFAQAMGERFGVPLAIADKVAEIFSEARETYGGDAWSPKVVKLLENIVGTNLRADGFPAKLS